MDTNRLKYFCAIAQTGSMRKAAELLRISAPALSKATRLLEEEVGAKLIHPVGRNIALTDAGKNLARRGAEILKNMDLLRREIEQPSIASKEIRVATFEVFSTYFLSALKHLPWDDTRFVFHDLLPGELERALQEGHVDIGITYMPVPMPEIEFVKICAIPMGVYTHKNAFPDAAQMELPFVIPAMPIAGAPTRVRGLDGWPDDAYSRKVKYQVTLMETALELCRQGRAAGYFPQFIAREHNERVKEKFKLQRRLSPYPGRDCTADVYIARRRSDPENREVRLLAKAIRKICLG